MQGFQPKRVKICASGNNITLNQFKGAYSGAINQAVVDKLHYETKIANDDFYYELEGRYGCVFAQWIVDRLP